MSLLSSSFSHVGLAEWELAGLEVGHVPEQRGSDGSIKAPTGLRRVEQVLQGQGGGEGWNWMVWGVFPCAVSVCTQKRAHFIARELIDRNNTGMEQRVYFALGIEFFLVS